jgi:hypothetical protein
MVYREFKYNINLEVTGNSKLWLFDDGTCRICDL